MRPIVATLIAAVSTFFLLAPGNQRAADLKAMIDALGSNASPEKKREVSRELVAAGKAAIPLLIGSLHDFRICERRDITNRMNRPVIRPSPKPLIATITVGERCEELLYEIITPASASPSAGNFKVYSRQILRVSSWQSWWHANEEKTLAEIHADLQPLVDEYWKQHGSTQTVELRIPEPAVWDQGFPIPGGARRNDSLGGATTLGPGRNFTVKVYDVDFDAETITAFYRAHLPQARRTSEGEATRFDAPGGYVRVEGSVRGARITLSLGPQ